MTPGKSLYEQVLERVGEGGAPPGARPARPSGAVVLWRRRGDSLEVFWVQRNERLRFMGGWHAFPGGGLSRRDGELAVTGRVSGLEGAPELGGLPELVLDGVPELGPILPDGLVAGVLRELFEEVGLLCAAPTPRGIEALPARLAAGEVDFHDWASATELRLDASELVYAGRWLTPPLGPVRFDTRFFLLEWPADRTHQPEVVPGELIAGEWIEPAAALERRATGEVMIAPPIEHILTVLRDDGAESHGRLHEPVEANLGSYRRVEFRPGVLLFPGLTPTLPPATHTNAYVLGLDAAVLIDPGSPFDSYVEGLIEAVRELRSRGLRRVEEIWLTHHHRDHVGGVERIRAALDLPVCAHRLAAEHLARMGIAVDRHLDEGERVELGSDTEPFPVRVLHTPGHARGHLSFFDERFGSLVTGDVVAGVGTIVVDPPEGDMNDYLATLERLEGLAPRALFPAHGPTVRNAVGKLAEYRRHRLWREERVLHAWRAGVRDLDSIVPAVYDDIPDAAQPLAKRQILAHLERLRGLGEIELGELESEKETTR